MSANLDTVLRQHGIDETDRPSSLMPLQDTAVASVRTPMGGGTTLIQRRRVRRRRLRLCGLLLCIGLPTAVVGGYLFGYAADQYVTEFRFTVRQQQALKSNPGSGLGASLSGANPLLAVLANSEVVVQYLQSHQVVDDIAGKVDLESVYGGKDADWWARMAPQASTEQRLRYWKRVVDPFFDMTTGVVSVSVRAFTPEDARRVAATALAASERLVNTMSDRAHHDAVAYAEAQTAEAEARLKKSEAAIAGYRNKNAVLFPQVQATASATFEGTLRSQLADARTTLSGLQAQGVHEGTPQTRILESRIAAIEGQLASAQSEITRQQAASPVVPTAAPQTTGTGVTAVDPSSPLASVLSGYSALDVEERISERAYERSLDALQDARNEADQQLIYLDAFVRPGLPQESTYPVRWRLILETALAGFVAWSLGMLFFHGLRDHLD
jgi:capsular polysaccharide transport system permease protein